MLTISPLTIAPDSILFENLPLGTNNLLLLPLKNMSYSKAYFSQKKTNTNTTDNAGLHRAKIWCHQHKQENITSKNYETNKAK